MPSPPLRIAILECDTPAPATDSKYKGYGGVFTSLLRTAAASKSLSHPTDSSESPLGLELTAYDVVTAQTYPSLSSVDAILLSGSKHNSFDNDEWILKLVAFTKQALEDEGVRVIGVCFGHQIVGRALGVEVGRSEGGWEVSVTPLKLTAKGQEIFGQTTLSIHQMHRDAVFTLPPSSTLLAETDKCPVQGFYKPKEYITVQGHPEFNEEIVRELLVLRHKTGIFNDEMFEDAMARVGKVQDGVVVAEAFLRFLLD